MAKQGTNTSEFFSGINAQRSYRPKLSMKELREIIETVFSGYFDDVMFFEQPELIRMKGLKWRHQFDQSFCLSDYQDLMATGLIEQRLVDLKRTVINKFEGVPEYYKSSSSKIMIPIDLPPFAK